ncbi:PQQ-dependent sugar dehydrogenase [Alteromonas sp. P256]|uniref:PQQ-dependent sugar dehydrogenase n=1 Tax=Alteromonas sp. P256 TaxID=3117399 RepID=UPI002FDF5EED
MIVLLKKPISRVDMKVTSALIVASTMLIACLSVSIKAQEAISEKPHSKESLLKEPVSKEAVSKEPLLTKSQYTTNVVIDGLSFPKSIEVLPSGVILVTQRDGQLAIINESNAQSRVKVSLPGLYTKGQGGWLDVIPADDFDTSSTLLLSYSKGTDSENKLVVVSGQFSSASGVTNIQPVFEINTFRDTPVHYGAKLLSLGNEEYLLTSGDGFDYREQAQVVSSHLGKVLGFTITGEPLANAPFPESPYVYTLGHRNPQGLVITQSGDILLNEHGPDGGDEINRVTRGNNYGWPVVTLGVDYSGAQISPFDHYDGMVNPVLDWTPSIAPSSMAIYNDDRFTALKNTAIVTALKTKRVYAVPLKNLREGSVVKGARLLLDKIDTRLRDVAIDKNGDILLLTDGEKGKVIRISPVN